LTIRFGWLRETVLMWVSGTGVCLVLLACGGGGGGTGVGNTSPSPFPPSIVSFLPGKGALTAGQGTTLTAVYTNATSATVDQGVGAVQSGVPVKVSPEASTNYTLTALGQGASATATLTLTVVPPPAISSFSASTQDVLAGGTTQLTPQFSGGAGTIDQGIGAVISGVPVTTSALNGATTFTLTVTNAAGDSVQLALPVAIHDRVTFLAGSGGTLVGSTLQDLTPGTSCTAVTAVPATGYAFSLWTGTNGFASTSSNPLIVASVNSSQAITAKFTTAICVLTYVAGANGSLTGSTVQSVAYGGSGTAVTAVPSPGYHFVQWSDGSTVNPRTDTSVTANVSVTATFAINTLTLAYAAGANGTLTGTSSQIVSYLASGTAVTAVPNPGYHFVQWSDGSTVNPRTDTSVTANVSVTATFAINTLTLAYAAGANGTLTGTSSQIVSYLASGTAVTAVPNPGYHFVQWSDGSTVNPRTDTSVTANVSVTATFAINALTLAYAAGANGTLTGTSSQIVNYLASGTAVTAVPSPGYHFVQWSDGSTVNPRTDTSVTANVSVTATFAINTFTISFQAGPNGTVGAPTSQVVNYGGNTTLIAALPSSGYTFLNWTGTNGFVMTTTNPVNVTNVTSDMTVTANFTNLNVVNFMAGSGGTLTGTASQSVANGGSATSVTAVPNANYGFLNWTGTGGFITTASNPLTVFNVTGNMTLTANFLHVPIINYFATSSTTIGKGQTGVLNWSPISFATSASIDQGVGSVSTGSSYALVTPTVTTTYTLTATNSAGSSSSQTTITVVPAPVITSFTATPSAVVPGQPTTLAWTVTGTGPFTYSLNQGIGTVTGNSVNVTPPTGAIVYTLTVSAYGVVQANVTVLSGAPATLSYTPSTLVYSKNVAITPVSPASTGGTITSYWSSPSLPSGLSVDPNTGIISGTPTGIAALASYTITGDNVYGSVHTTVNVTVNDTPPSVTYGSGPFSYKVGSTVTLSPTNTGGAVTGWSISPSLPAGLTFNTSNGQITGIPSAITASQSYTVTATNSGGSSSPVLVIATSQTPPVIAYGSPSYTSYVGVSIRTIAPTNTGDPATWAIYPSLPQNLIFDSGSGQISGTPSGLSSGTLYTVEATNLAGSSQATFTLSVSVPAPVITTQPFGQILSIGAVPTFAVAATGTGTLTSSVQKFL